MAISDGFLLEFDQESKLTRVVLQRCPEEKFGWQPHAKSWPMGKLATHVANLPSWLALTLQQDSLDIAPPGQPAYQDEAATSSKALLGLFDKNTAAARAAVAETGDEEYMKEWTLLKAGQKIFSMRKLNCIRSFVMNHTVHHRAQLTVYLRLNDVPVPTIYGPSADEGSM